MRMTLTDAFFLFYCYALDFKIHQTEKMMKTMAHSSIVRFYSSMTEKLSSETKQWILSGSIEGATNVIEIDECLFGRKRKYNKGRYLRRQWVFGIVERMTRKTFFKVILDRSSETLIPLIKEKVLTGATIYSDDWRGYRSLNQFGYNHGCFSTQQRIRFQDGSLHEYDCSLGTLLASNCLTVISLLMH